MQKLYFRQHVLLIFGANIWQKSLLHAPYLSFVRRFASAVVMWGAFGCRFVPHERASIADNYNS